MQLKCICVQTYRTNYNQLSLITQKVMFAMKKRNTRFYNNAWTWILIVLTGVGWAMMIIVMMIMTTTMVVNTRTITDY